MHKRTVGLVAASIVAVVLAGGSAADAGSLITGKNVKDNSLTGKDIKDGTLTLKDFKASERIKLRGPAGPRGSINATVVQSPTVTIAAYDSGSVVAFCPSGKKVTGGGYFSSVAIAAGSLPNDLQNGWGAVINNYDNPIPVEVHAYAVCA